MVENQTAYSRFEQSSVIQFLVVENCKTCKIHRRMWDMYRVASFSQRIYKWVKLGFTTMSLCQKDCP